MNLAKLGFILIFIGFAIAILAAFLPLISSPISDHEIGVGGCIIVFFIPICFGTGTHGLGTIMMVIAIILAIILMVLAFIIFRTLFKSIEAYRSGTY